MEVEIIKTFYDDGMLQKENTYLNGVKHGIQRWYHENGEKLYECYSENGNWKGLDQYWNYDGTRDYIRKWKNSQENSPHIIFKY